MLKIYKKIYDKFGPQGWWPVISNNPKLEICIGAILTQNTSWKNVEKSIKNLEENNLLNLKQLKKIKTKKLALLIKSSGYYNQKARKIKEFVRFLSSNKKINRENLLNIWGIGPETADSILLYAYNQPIFVIDAYTKRIFERLGYKEQDYDNLQKFIIKNIPKKTKIYKEYHALLVKLGKEHCRTKPICNNCPLSSNCRTLTS